MKTKYQIVEELAKARVVEEMCCNVAHSSELTDDLKDLAQIIYVALLEYKEEYIVDLAKDQAIRFFIARMIANQWNTNHSPFRDLITRFSSMTEEIRNNDETDD